MAVARLATSFGSMSGESLSSSLLEKTHLSSNTKQPVPIIMTDNLTSTSSMFEDIASQIGENHTSVNSLTTLSPYNETSHPTTAKTDFASLNYNGLIGINGTDPYAITQESTRIFAISPNIQILMCILYGFLAFTAITSNMIVCYIVLSNQRMRTATNYFIVNLAVGDILMALLCIPFSFAANLIFQHWPFGLSLCVIVSYSQANSVFISAYTMVAISIDKYIAIMYPMRLRMPKIKAKIIILVIWSAALITSLPTALLSSLDSIPVATTQPPPINNPTTTSKPTEAVSMSTYPKNKSTTRLTPKLFSDSTESTTIQSNAIRFEESESIAQQQEQIAQQLEQRKYFCQESWTFWPIGKYYYSMALMLLQFVVPLFVLVITYSRIVIVVWGQKMPGEEDNARDARMARSKRKVPNATADLISFYRVQWSIKEEFNRAA